MAKLLDRLAETVHIAQDARLGRHPDGTPTTQVVPRPGRNGRATAPETAAPAAPFDALVDRLAEPAARASYVTLDVLADALADPAQRLDAAERRLAELEAAAESMAAVGERMLAVLQALTDTAPAPAPPAESAPAPAPAACPVAGPLTLRLAEMAGIDPDTVRAMLAHKLYRRYRPLRELSAECCGRAPAYCGATLSWLLRQPRSVDTPLSRWEYLRALHPAAAEDWLAAEFEACRRALA